MNADSHRAHSARQRLGALLGIFAVIASASLAHADSLRFRDGERVEGRLLSIRSDRIQFRPEGEPSLTIPLEEVGAVLLSTRTTNDLVRPANRIELSGQQSISGRLVGMDRSRVTLDTGYARDINVPRSEVKTIRWTGQRSGVHYEGPYPTNEWYISSSLNTDTKQFDPSWIFRDGYFLSQGKGTLSVDCGMPIKARIEFDLYWKNAPRFRLACYARDLVSYSESEGYHFYSSGNGKVFAITRGREPGQAIQVPKGIVPQMTNTNHVHFDLRLNSQDGEGWLFANGREIKRWTDLGYSGSGMGIMFYTYRSNTRIAVGNLRVSEWDGRSTVESRQSKAATSVLFRNGDRHAADDIVVESDRLKFAFEDQSIEIPMNRVAEINQRIVKRMEKSNDADSWVQFMHGDWLRAQILDWNSKRVVWRSPLLGRQESKPHQIRGVHFTEEKPVLDLSWYLPKNPIRQ